MLGGITNLLTSGDIQVGPILVSKSNLMEIYGNSWGMRDFRWVIVHCLKFAWCHIINPYLCIYVVYIYMYVYIYIIISRGFSSYIYQRRFLGKIPISAWAWAFLHPRLASLCQNGWRRPCWWEANGCYGMGPILGILKSWSKEKQWTRGLQKW